MICPLRCDRRGSIRLSLFPLLASLLLFGSAASLCADDRLSADPIEPTPFKAIRSETKQADGDALAEEDEQGPTKSRETVNADQRLIRRLRERVENFEKPREAQVVRSNRKSIEPPKDPLQPTPFERPEPEKAADEERPADESDPNAGLEDVMDQYGGGQLPESLPDTGPSDLSADAELRATIERMENVSAVDAADELLYEGLADVQDENYSLAIPKLEKVIELKPTLGAAWESLGWCYYRTGDVEKTRRLWNQLRVLDPDRPLPYNLLAKLAAAENNLPKAIEYYNRSLEMDPDQYRVRYDMARIMRWQGSLDVAIEMLQKTFAEDSDRTDVMLDLARALTDNWDYSKALPLWIKLRELAPGNREFIEGEALCRLHTGDIEQAQELTEMLLEDDPSNQVGLLISANIAQLSDKPENAIPYLKRVMKNEEEDPVQKESVRVRLLRLYVALHKSNPARFGLAEAVALSRERIKYDQKSVDARLMLGELLLMQGEYDQAEIIFSFILARINPHNLRARKGMFETKMAMRDYKAAREQLVGIASFNPHDPYLYYYIARWESMQGDYYGAYEALDKLEAVGQKGAVPVFLYHGLTPSTHFMDALSVDRFREQIQALKDAGFQFMKSSEIPDFFRNRNFQGTGILLDERRLNIPPEKVVVINFDDGRRDSMRYGTRVALEKDVVFSMHIPTGYVDMRHPFICTWEQLEAYAKTGVWDFGSHFKNAAILAPIDGHGRLGHALPNRIWLEDPGRLENMREYQERLEIESSESRSQLRSRLSGSVNFVSYPFGDVGQEIDTNVRNPTATILEHVRPHYDVGFIQSPFGFAVNSDDPLLYQRHEMDRFASGEEVVEHIFLNHPVYLARRQRAELAALQGKQYMATEILDQLELAGYPERLLTELRRDVYNNLAGKIDKSAETGAGEKIFGLPLRNPYLGAEAEYFSDNQDRSRELVLGYGGIEIMRRFAIEGLAGVGNLKQDVLAEDGTGNKRSIDIDETDIGLRAAFNITASSYLRGEIVQRSFSASSNDYSKIKYAIEGQIRPVLACDLQLRYEQDAGPSAMAVEQEIESDSFWANGFYRMTDNWDLTAALIDFDFSDDNNRSHYSLGSSWLLNQRTGFRAGVGYSYVSADRETQAYWTPYELQRFYLEGGFQGSYLRNYYNLRLRLGAGRESVRPEDDAAYRQLQQRAALQNFDPGPAPSEDWETVIGVSASTRIPIRNNWNLNGEISYSKLPNYDSLNINGGIEYEF